MNTRKGETRQVDTIKVYIGSIQTGNGGLTRDTTKTVEFSGEAIASYNEPGTGRDGGVTDTRGVKQTLYRTADGRLVAHVEDWSHWQGEPTCYSLYAVEPSDLQPGGRFETLGDVAGYGRPLSLDEALAQPDREAWAAGADFLAGDVLEAGCIVTDPATVEEMASGEVGL